MKAKPETPETMKALKDQSWRNLANALEILSIRIIFSENFEPIDYISKNMNTKFSCAKYNIHGQVVTRMVASKIQIHTIAAMLADFKSTEIQTHSMSTGVIITRSLSQIRNNMIRYSLYDPENNRPPSLEPIIGSMVDIARSPSWGSFFEARYEPPATGNRQDATLSITTKPAEQ